MEKRVRHLHTIYNKNDYVIASFTDLDDYSTFTAKGYMIPTENICDYILIGEFVDEIKGGTKRTAFNVIKWEEILPSEEESIVKYLSTLRGVGKVTAKKLYKAFGNCVFDIIKNTPEEMAKISGISLDKALLIEHDYLKKQSNKELFTFLYQNNIKGYIVSQIYSVFREDSVRLIKENPYILSMHFKVSFSQADNIAKRLGIAKDSHLRIKGAIVEVLKQNQSGGNLFSFYPKFPYFCNRRFLREELYEYIKEPTKYDFSTTGNTCINSDILYLQVLRILNSPLAEKTFFECLQTLYKEHIVYLQNDATPMRYIVYLYKTAMQEFFIAKTIAKMAKKPKEQIAHLNDYLSFVENDLVLKLSYQQEEAVKQALSHSVSIVTGGPGTGKTSVLKALLETYKMIYPEKHIYLAAPTGTAAKKMSETAEYPASTIHALLEIREEIDDLSVTQTYSNKAIDLLIIDESSMIDLNLMYHIINSISHTTKLVFIGDIDQLPSVDAGAVLKSLIDSKIIPVTFLTEVFRQASGSLIAMNSKKIKIGETRLDYTAEFNFIEANNGEEIVNIVKKQYERIINEYGDNILVLTSFRRNTLTGSDSLNKILQSEFLKGTPLPSPTYKKAGVEFHVGDKVMYTKNYKTLANGDVGVIEKIFFADDVYNMIIDFNGEHKTLSDDELLPLTLAYVTTVHKSQGLEYDAIIQIVDPQHKIMLKRNLLYTGITRAKKEIILIGNKAAFERGIRTEDSSKRYSRLSPLLSNYYYYDSAFPQTTVSNTKDSLDNEQLSFID